MVSDPSIAELWTLDAVPLAGLIRTREVSAQEVVTAHIARVEAVNGAINALVTPTFERALEQALAADEAAANGSFTGLLHGLPVAHKDLLDTAGVRTTYGSPIFAEHVPDRDALVVRRMREAGAISLGKTNTPEFGTGSHTVNAVFGATHNPYHLRRSAGGSSGGAAAALAARMVCLADGSDFGGSLRNPASFCNVVGLRPSPGRVPSWPVADVADQLTVEGPMARTVTDVAFLLAVLSGPAAEVPFALDAPGPPVRSAADVHRLLEVDMRGLTVGWSDDLGLPLEPQVRAVLSGARQVLVDLGCTVIDVAPDLGGADEVFRTLRAFRYSTSLGTLLDQYPEKVGPNVAWNIQRGRELTVDDLRRVTHLRNDLAGRVNDFMADVDLLACPTSQVSPFDIELDWVREIDGESQTSYLDWMASAYLITATGLPALSVPAGFTAEGLPVGLQLVGRRRADWDLLAAAHGFESATHYSRILPDVPAGPGESAG